MSINRDIIVIVTKIIKSHRHTSKWLIPSIILVRPSDYTLGGKRQNSRYNERLASSSALQGFPDSMGISYECDFSVEAEKSVKSLWVDMWRGRTTSVTVASGGKQKEVKTDADHVW
jgi:hypothetical protein